jgi:cold shock CspA family protein|tara:strand:+ start:309 stop:506 length:198 start_codon:yes stop_codon:yes gene_type:complete
MKLGTIKNWNRLKGWGFIDCEEDDQDYFFHISDVRKGLNPSEGMKVKFDPQVGQKGDEAKNISHI